MANVLSPPLFCLTHASLSHFKYMFGVNRRSVSSNKSGTTEWNYTDPDCGQEEVRRSTVLQRPSLLSTEIIDSYNQVANSLSKLSYLPLGTRSYGRYEVRALYTREGMKLCFHPTDEEKQCRARKDA
ncbi:hypothetical protein CROQUDRAFT_129731 [Cronartium quercuum f. sp. fusiforme G11]|uniref:Uncharacterized protein n=1 Tax=Cronartium quercuum f. sp. fusiforme G11 TaxID=708437 RepID=A0A9P6TGX2_9BASI|nr:hypothetical protein CROQUDRAFT_129731 [Cronartium quercuum f. sp. fusiforme G11]